MRVPIEYGDNFPVLSGSWNPAVPWRFPRVERTRRPRSLLGRVFPWVMLGLGMAVGILWMSCRQGSVGASAGEGRAGMRPSTEQAGEVLSPYFRVPPAEAAPKAQPLRVRSELA